MIINYGIYIGRFQPFHNAHLETVRVALKRFDRLIIVLGSDKQARNIKNPWSTAERIALIQSCLTDDECKRIHFMPAGDYLYNDNLWLTAVQSGVAQIIANETDEWNVSIIGRKKNNSTVYFDLFPQWTFVDSGVRLDTDATKIRELMFTQDKLGIKHLVPPSVYDALCSYMETSEYQRLHEEYHHILNYRARWAHTPFPPTFNTVDAIVIKSGHVLVVRRRCAPGKGLIALPGGYINHDETIINGCLRELKEETSISISYHELKKYLSDEKVFDHPQRSLRGRTITHAFCFNMGHGDLPHVKGGDDASKSWWMPLRDVMAREHEFFEDHFHIITYFANRF